MNRLKQKLTGDKVTQWYVVPGLYVHSLPYKLRWVEKVVLVFLETSGCGDGKLTLVRLLIWFKVSSFIITYTRETFGILSLTVSLGL